ncbi:putative isomerase YddE [Roseibium album]|nr:putative isomerase YddE [Roseibium album]
MDILRISAFSDGNKGGNPAGVLICDQLPPAEEMQKIAADVGYSETAFAMPDATDDAWRVRYFSPESEVPFCGHATIALGSALAQKFGRGLYRLTLNKTQITVEGSESDGLFQAALQSPPTQSSPSSVEVTEEVLDLFGYHGSQLDDRIGPAFINGGAGHFVLPLNSRQALADMSYDLDAGRTLMNRQGWVTIMLAFSENHRRFHTRNPFASGGVYEDPATGAASAAFAGYLRDLDWPHEGSIELIQGADMGMPCRIHAKIPDEKGSSIRVSGAARLMSDS